MDVLINNVTHDVTVKPVYQLPDTGIIDKEECPLIKINFVLDKIIFNANFSYNKEFARWVVDDQDNDFEKFYTYCIMSLDIRPSDVAGYLHKICTDALYYADIDITKSLIKNRKTYRYLSFNEHAEESSIVMECANIVGENKAEVVFKRGNEKEIITYFLNNNEWKTHKTGDSYKNVLRYFIEDFDVSRSVAERVLHIDAMLAIHDKLEYFSGDVQKNTM